MNIVVRALDYNRDLVIPAAPNELVRSIKAKIDQQMGPGRVPEEEIDSLYFNGRTLDCSTPLFAYGITNGSLLYMGRALIPQQAVVAAPAQPAPVQYLPQAQIQAAPVQTVAVPQNQQGPLRFWNPVQGYHYH